MSFVETDFPPPQKKNVFTPKDKKQKGIENKGSDATYRRAHYWWYTSYRSQ